MNDKDPRVALFEVRKVDKERVVIGVGHGFMGDEGARSSVGGKVGMTRTESKEGKGQRCRIRDIGNRGRESATAQGKATQDSGAEAMQVTTDSRAGLKFVAV